MMAVTDIHELFQLPKVEGGGLDSVGPAVLTTVVVVLSALVPALLIGWVYRRTYRGLQYSRSFVFALALLPSIVAVMVMVIGGNVAMAFGAFGALSLIRFRIAIKDNVDLTYVFLAIAVGFCMGGGRPWVGAAVTAIILAVIVVLSRFNFGSIRADEWIVRFRVRGDRAAADLRRDDVFARFLTRSILLNMTVTADGATELVYAVSFRDPAQNGRFLEELAADGALDGVGLVNTRGDLEL